MTRKEFEVFRISLEKEKFPKVISDPIEYGIQRAIFRKERLKKLIGVGNSIRSRTIQSKIMRWKRQLEKLDHSQEHLLSLKQEIQSSRLDVAVPLPTLASSSGQPHSFKPTLSLRTSVKA